MFGVFSVNFAVGICITVSSAYYFSTKLYKNYKSSQIQSAVNQIINDVILLPAASLPSQVIHQIAERAWQPLIISLLKQVNGENSIRKFSSCVNTALACHALFCGVQRARDIALKQEGLRRFNLIMPSGKLVFFNVKGLFDGLAEAAASHDRKIKKHVAALEGQQAGRFTKYLFSYQCLIASLPSDNEAKKFLASAPLSFSFDFNQETFALLEMEMRQKSKQVNNERSFSYYFTIKNEISVEHAFVIEQYLNEMHQVSYNLYQSWVNLSSLKEELAKDDQSGLDWQQLWQFLRSIQKALLPGALENEPNKLSQCFGFKEHNSLRIKYADDELKGLKLIYYVDAFKPAQVLVNLKEILQI